MLRFTIRDVLWLTVVVGMGLVWWLDRSRLIANIEDRELLVGELRELMKVQHPGTKVEIYVHRGMIETKRQPGPASPQ